MVKLYLSVFECLLSCLMLTVCTKGLRVTQFQFSVCMYCTCGRIDNKTLLDLKLLLLFSLNTIAAKRAINPTRTVTHLGLIFSPFSWRVSKTSFPFRTRQTFSFLSSISTNMYSTCKMFKTLFTTVHHVTKATQYYLHVKVWALCLSLMYYAYYGCVDLNCKSNDDKAQYCFSPNIDNICYESKK